MRKKFKKSIRKGTAGKVLKSYRVSRGGIML